MPVPNARNPDEIRTWWNNPYIVTKAWHEIETSYEADKKQSCARYLGNCEFQLDELDRRKQLAREKWFNLYPYGIRYEICCLDGRVPYRSSVWGTEGTLRAAIHCAKTGPYWGREQSTVLTIGENKMIKHDEIEIDEFENEGSELELQVTHWVKVTTDNEVTDADRAACERWLAKSQLHRQLYNDFMAM